MQDSEAPGWYAAHWWERGSYRVEEKASTLLGERVRRRREPDMSDAGLGDVVHLAHQEVVPSSVLLPRLPVEALVEGGTN